MKTGQEHVNRCAGVTDAVEPSKAETVLGTDGDLGRARERVGGGLRCLGRRRGGTG